MNFRKALVSIAVLTLLSACAKQDLTQAPEPIGDFVLGFNIVVAKNAEPVGPSRKAEPEEWETLLKEKIAAQIGRYDGDRIYNLAVGVDAYALAVPGVPILLSPKSVLAVTVNIWDDALALKLNEKPKQLIVFERLSGETVVGSGLTQTREQQMQNLTENAARLINNWLVENKAWFTPEAVAARSGLPAPVATVPVPAAPAIQATSPVAPPAAPTTPVPGAPLRDASGDLITLP
jgi:hypothetical protein